MKISTPRLMSALAVLMTGIGCNSMKPTTVSASSGNTSPESHAPVVPALNSNVNSVRNGFLGGFNSTTVGKAFDATFQNAEWKSFVTPKGITIVEFNGTVTGTGVVDWSDGAENRCIASLGLGDTIKGLNERKAAYAARYEEAEKIKEMTRAEQDAASQRVYALKAQERQEVGVPFEEINKQIVKCEEQAPIPVSFQFTLSADKTTFELSYIDPRPWKTSTFMEATGVHYEERGSFSRYVTDQGVSTEKVLGFIYH